MSTASTLKQKVAVYLGLAEDDYAYDYDERPAQQSSSGQVAVDESYGSSAGPRRIEAVYDVVRMSPTAYADVRGVGESYRAGDVVAMDLAMLPADDAKRMIDFASGLTFGLQGTIERVGAKVFLLTPKGVEVAASVRSSLIP